MFDNRNITEYFFNDIKVGDAELLFCGHQKCVPGHSYGPFIRTHYLLIFVSSGKGAFRNQYASYTLTAGCTFCVFPGEVTYYEADYNTPWEYYWIAFNGTINTENIEHFLMQAFISRQQPIHIASDGTRLHQLYAEMFQLCQNQTNHIDLKLMSLFLDLLWQYTALRNCYEPNTHPDEQFSSGYISQALDYIQAHYQENISVSVVAGKLGISREYLSCLFKQQLHISPSRFIREYRLKCSTILLLSTNYPILQIACLVGFNDYNYYSNQFKKLYGISPNQYRCSWRTNGTVPDPFRN